MAKIEANTIGTAATLLRGHLFDYAHEIDTAYCKTEDVLMVNLSVKFSPAGGGIRVATGITFTTAKIKDGAAVVVDEKQKPMFDAEGNAV